MAKVAPDPKLREWVDDYLTYLTRVWEAMPEQAAEWGEWDQDSKTSFALDWPICEDRLHQLREWAERDLLSPSQRARYEELLKLVAQNRHILERLLEE